MLAWVVVLLFVQQMFAYAEETEGADKKAVFRINKEKAELRLDGFDAENTETQYELLFFAQSETGELWVCVNPDRNKWLGYAELEKYGAEVVHYLGEQGEKAVLILSRENTNYMLCSYSDFFVETETDKKEPAIELRKGKTVSDLIERFRTYLEIDVLLAFMSEKTVSVLRRQSFRD